jgi:hypothetical protein
MSSLSGATLQEILLGSDCSTLEYRAFGDEICPLSGHFVPANWLAGKLAEVGDIRDNHQT